MTDCGRRCDHNIVCSRSRNHPGPHRAEVGEPRWVETPSGGQLQAQLHEWIET